MYNKEWIRQGDVSLHRIEELPLGVKKAKDNILAHGEITGHQHRITSQVYELEGKKFVDVVDEGLLIHDTAGNNGVMTVQEAVQQDKHIVRTIPKGVWAVTIEEEESWDGTIKQVMD